MLQWVECFLQIQEIEFEGEIFLPLSLWERRVNLEISRFLRTMRSCSLTNAFLQCDFFPFVFLIVSQNSSTSRPLPAGRGFPVYSQWCLRSSAEEEGRARPPWAKLSRDLWNAGRFPGSQGLTGHSGLTGRSWFRWMSSVGWAKPLVSNQPHARRRQVVELRQR